MGGAIKLPPALRLTRDAAQVGTPVRDGFARSPHYWPSKRGEHSADDGPEPRMTRTIKLLASISKTNAGCFISGRYRGTEAKH
jgi:hypothetical protein